MARKRNCDIMSDKFGVDKSCKLRRKIIQERRKERKKKKSQNNKITKTWNTFKTEDNKNSFQ